MQIFQDQRQGSENYEFSFRRGYGTRLFVRLPAKSLAVFRRTGAGSRTDLTLVLEHHAALCDVAIERSRDELTTVVEISEADAAAVLAASLAKRSPQWDVSGLSCVRQSSLGDLKVPQTQAKDGSSQQTDDRITFPLPGFP